MATGRRAARHDNLHACLVDDSNSLLVLSVLLSVRGGLFLCYNSSAAPQVGSLALVENQTAS